MKYKSDTVDELSKFSDFKKGSEAAFEYYYTKHFNHILGFCIQFIYDKQEAESITQDAFVHLWSNRDQVKKNSGISSFLYTYARSKCLNYLRHNKVKTRYQNNFLNKMETSLNTEVLDSLQFDALTFIELETLIYESIEDLPEKTREVFLKKRFENLKNKEIATELNISIKTVEAHTTKALKVLSVNLSDYINVLLLIYFTNN